MAHPTASSSQPAQIPALDSPHAAADKVPKEKKGQGKQQTNTSDASPFPLEVRSPFLILIFKHKHKLNNLIYSFNQNLHSLIIV